MSLISTMCSGGAMSSIGEAREQIEETIASGEEAQEGLGLVGRSLDRASAEVRRAAGDTGHPQVDAALKSCQAAAQRLVEIGELLVVGQEAVNDYAEVLR